MCFAIDNDNSYRFIDFPPRIRHSSVISSDQCSLTVAQFYYYRINYKDSVHIFFAWYIGLKFIRKEIKGMAVDCSRGVNSGQRSKSVNERRGV